MPGQQRDEHPDPRPAPARVLVLMGSGELAPTMAKVHREVVGRLGGSSARCVLLETPFAFQENAAELAAKAAAYFSTSLGLNLLPAGLVAPRSGEGDAGSAGDDPLAAERTTAAIRTADYVFAGPGSPSYALRRWRHGVVPRLLAEKLAFGGGVCFASAAALCLGAFTVPVYEIYKVGQDPHWLEGLDLLGPLGLHVAVVPHYDNAEGGTHDTRFSYLGERRLREMEAQLPEDVLVLGIDEHTALVLDVASGSASVGGLGSVTVRAQGRSVVFPTGSATSIDELRNAAVASSRAAPADRASPAGVTDGGPAVSPAGTAEPAPGAGATGTFVAGEAFASSPLLRIVHGAEAAFGAALVAGDADAAVHAVLELEQALGEWTTDIPQGDELERARAGVRSMVVELGQLAGAVLRDSRAVVGPLVEPLLELRQLARAEGRYDVADRVRDLLVAEGVELHDTPAGTTWQLAAAAAAGRAAC